MLHLSVTYVYSDQHNAYMREVRVVVKWTLWATHSTIGIWNLFSRPRSQSARTQ